MGNIGSVQTDWTVVYPEIIQSAISLFFSGFSILLAVLALYFMSRRRSPGRRVFICASIVLCVFGIAQVIDQVVITALMLRMYSSAVDRAADQNNQSSIHHLADIKWISDNFLILTNNFAADTLLIYRCYVIWGQSRYKRWVVGPPLILLIFTTMFGCVVTALTMSSGDLGVSAFHNTGNTVVVALGMIITNLLLTGLTAGRIWWTRRHLRVVGQPTLLQRYDTAIAMLLESGALYFAVIMTFLVAQLVGGSTVFEASWFAALCGASGQLLNIIPALIIVRVSLKRSVDIDATTQANLKLESSVY
ncbi:hypothetical protein FB451DRAFT_1283613 [Mycena latifolia]|nr:hypothetical protein FB451DRAFT_1283613 [Mycena latifolia]